MGDKRKKLLQVMTIAEDDADRFDLRVNFALNEGWYIEKRYTVVIAAPLFVAEMRRYLDLDTGETTGEAW